MIDVEKSLELLAAKNRTLKQRSADYRQGKRPPSQPFPPWVRDQSPENWQLVKVAARHYFHKSVGAIKNYILSGELERQGIPSYWDGNRWYVRLPTLTAPTTLSPTPSRNLKDQLREKNLHKYGLTLEQYDQLVMAQDGQCAICGDVPKLLHVDHDHENGRVRGLLCGPCNAALRMFRDNVEALHSAIRYLTAARTAKSGKSA